MGSRFVVVALGALACGTKTGPEGTPPPEELITRNPPAPVEPVPVEPVPVEPAPAPAQSSGLLNGSDLQGRTIFRAADGSCYVNLPPPPPAPGAPVVSFRPPIREAAECPAAMKAAGWEACVGGTLRKAEAGSDCLCTVLGNPPPPPRAIACPQGEG